jgi:arylsulfatase A-like enzyme
LFPILWGFVVLVAVGVFLAGFASAQGANGPDVLLVILDDVSDEALDQISPTPTIDALAARGIRYRRAYGMPTCGPARATLAFGRYVGRDLGSCGTPVAGITPEPEDLLLADYARGAGYATALVGKWHVGASWSPALAAPPRQGFDTWTAGTYDNLNSACGPGKGYWRWQRVDADSQGFTQGVVTTFATADQRDSMIDWWTATPSPKLAVLALNAGHSPYGPNDAPPPSMLPTGYQTPLSPREVFEAQIVAADFALGELLAFVDPATTLVILTADNGTSGTVACCGEDPAKVKQTTFEGGIRVPMIAAGPGVAYGIQSWNLAHLVDLMPTIALRLGAKPARGVVYNGIPMRLGDGLETRTIAYCDYQPLVAGFVRDRCAVDWRWKVRRVGDVAPFVEELYDLLVDPEETMPMPLSAGPPATVAALVVELNAHE